MGRHLAKVWAKLREREVDGYRSGCGGGSGGGGVRYWPQQVRDSFKWRIVSVCMGCVRREFWGRRWKFARGLVFFWPLLCPGKNYSAS